MKIGIITFHWGTNYGAVLQAWCLQEYLVEQGHSVEIINYKPSQYELSWIRIAIHPRLWRNVKRQFLAIKKEKMLTLFREKWLHMTKMYRSIDELRDNLDRYDILISGSDQVLNPGFTIHGENGKPSSAYWLSYGRKNTKRIGYSVSFGTEKYPKNAVVLARQWVNNFDIIGTRENTGLKILEQIGYKGPSCLTPDPTILLGSKIYDLLGIKSKNNYDKYTCVYMLRHEISIEGNVRYIDETHHPIPLNKWLETIACATRLVTNSYHGTLMAIFAHIPFSILLETGDGSGMNDRFFTLLHRIGCEDRVARSIDEVMNVFEKEIDYSKIDALIKDFRQDGVDFLSF